jgi:hypothetical protein
MNPWNTTTPRRRLLAGGGGLLLVSALAVLAIGSAGVGAATVAPAGGPVAVMATLDSSPVGKIVVAGAIGDWGTAVAIDRNGRPDENGDYVKVTLRKGSFEIDSRALNRKTANPRPQVASDTTCSVSAAGSAPVTFFDGTGLYKGITGTADVTLTFTGVGRRYASGPKKGQCKHGDEQPLATIATVIGRGSIRFK